MRTLILGMGASGTEVAKFLMKRGQPFDTFDDKKDRNTVAAAVEATSFHHYSHANEPELGRYRQVVVSPGVDARHPLLARARQQGVDPVSEIELAFNHVRGKVVAVTGSNGKSTTVSLIHHVLLGGGLNAVLCGNIGVPFIAKVSDDPDRIYVLEVSSFQLEHIRRFRPNLGILLNITPDHLARHGGFEAYKRAKLRLFENQEADDLAVVDPDHFRDIPGRAQKLAVPGPEAFQAETEWVVSESYRVPCASLPLLGAHNRLNGLFTCVAAWRMGVPAEVAAQALQSFRALEHRLESVGFYEGRHWINDSKATNGQATQAAVDAMVGPYALILGGCDKGERFRDLDFSRNSPKAVVAYGETAPLICEDLAFLHPVHVHRFEDACLKAHELAGSGSAVLLAPACASFDQFGNFAERGTAFKAIFRRMAVAS